MSPPPWRRLSSAAIRPRSLFTAQGKGEEEEGGGRPRAGGENQRGPGHEDGRSQRCRLLAILRDLPCRCLLTSSSSSSLAVSRHFLVPGCGICHEGGLELGNSREPPSRLSLPPLQPISKSPGFSPGYRGPQYRRADEASSSAPPSPSTRCGESALATATPT
jgi:hypothetical protein